MKISRLAGLGSLVLLATLVSCSSTSISSHARPEYSFAGLTTYALLPEPSGGERSPASLEFMDRRTNPEVSRAMKAKGYVEAPRETADLLVETQISTTGKVEVARAGYRVAGWDTWGRWGTVHVSSTHYQTGLFVVDVVDAKKNTLVFRAEVETVARLDGEATQEQIRGMVIKMLAALPKRS